MIFVGHLDAHSLAQSYASFWKTLTWYRMYCVGRFGKDKASYKDGFESLKGSFEWLAENDNVSIYIKEPVTSLLEKIETRLNRKRLTDADIKYIADVLWEFENTWEDFSEKYLSAYLRRLAEKDLPKGMHPVLQLLDDEESNSAIVDSFKYFDWLLQKWLGVSPHDYYGESLVNFAFAPGEGKIKLNTHDNEQRGLRNLTSGLYALFRNPTAHRDIFDKNTGIIRLDGNVQTAATITSVISLLARLIYQNMFLSMDELIRKELNEFAQKHDWNTEIIQYPWSTYLEYSWGIGLIPESKYKSFRDCQLLVTLAEDNNGPYLSVRFKSQVEKQEIELFLSNIQQVSNLRAILRNPEKS
ncbi:MAG: TIGR02391 family protein [Anaerolineales bacterium]|nr:MAG: TIGR02391 family protein [Anaerolineales bacterium]